MGPRVRAIRRGAALIGVALLACAGSANAAGPEGARYAAGELVVRYVGHRLPTEVKLPDGIPVPAAVRALRLNPAVAYAVPNYVISPADYVPNDPGKAGTSGGWRKLQWNFRDGPGGVRGQEAWDNLIAAGRPGGAGVTVAVLDTGVAYRDKDRFRKSPDFSSSQFTDAKYDFQHDDPYPLDKVAHGTPVAGVIAERTNNGKYLTGLAYGVKIMPIRVVNKASGKADDLAAGIRYAAAHGADVINISLQFDEGVNASHVPEVIEAINQAHSEGAVIVAAAGNQGTPQVTFPARADHVIAVGASSVDGCLTGYSNYGGGLDLLAPGGGSNSSTDLNCGGKPNAGTRVYQVSQRSGDYRHFGQIGRTGTSMAAPHVSAAAALVIASGVLGPSWTPDAVEQRLESTSRKQLSGLYVAGLLDAAAATTP